MLLSQKTMDNCDKISIVVSNILSKKRYSHCRLCLSDIEENYVRLNDTVSLNPNSGIFQSLHSLLINLLGEEFGAHILGIDAVCVECVNSALTSMRFIESCRSTGETLKTAIENISNAFDRNINMGSSDKLFINFNKSETELLILTKPLRKRKQTFRKIFECFECLVYFDTFDDLKVHNVCSHGSVTCDKCNKTFLSDKELCQHESDEHKFTCPECPHFHGTEEGLKEHLDQYHIFHICKECGKPCKGLEKLNIHEEKHKTKNTCPKCGKSYTTKDFFDRHVKLCINDLIEPHPSRSSMKKSYRCEKCDKAYSTQGGLRVHNRFAHGSARPHICHECGKMFTAPSYLAVHMVKHTGEKNFKCGICDNKFVTKEALLYHTRRHTGEKPYSCKQCNERFVNASARAEHIKFKHIGPQLVCEICSKKFVTRYFLKQHLNRHHDPTSKLYYGRSMIPPNLPLEENMRNFIVKNNS